MNFLQCPFWSCKLCSRGRKKNTLEEYPIHSLMNVTNNILLSGLVDKGFIGIPCWIFRNSLVFDGGPCRFLCQIKVKYIMMGFFPLINSVYTTHAQVALPGLTNRESKSLTESHCVDKDATTAGNGYCHRVGGDCTTHIRDTHHAGIEHTRTHTHELCTVVRQKLTTGKCTRLSNSDVYGHSLLCSYSSVSTRARRCSLRAAIKFVLWVLHTPEGVHKKYHTITCTNPGVWIQ